MLFKRPYHLFVHIEMKLEQVKLFKTLPAIFLFYAFTQGLLLPSYVEAETSEKAVKVEGSGCFTYGDNDSPASAKKRAFQTAKRNAIENYKSFVSSSSELKDFELEEDLITTLAAGYLYRTKIIKKVEKGREICIHVEAYVKPAEIDKLLAENKKPRDTENEQKLSKKTDGQESPKMKKGKELAGVWESFKRRPSKSSFSLDKDGAAVWNYSVPKIKRNTYAGLDFNINPTSMKGRTLLIVLHSTNGHPIHIRFFSFLPGYSKEGDDDTFVPNETSVDLKPDSQEIQLDPSNFYIPSWWREENNANTVSFFLEDIRKIEFEAQVDEDIGPVFDTITIKAIRMR